MEKVLFDSEFATVWVDPVKKIIRHKFKKFMFGEGFREVMLKAADAFAEYKCTKWLSDDRENSSLKSEDRDWAYKVWGPKVIKAGWKHWAIVLPKKIFGEVDMTKISKQYTELGINVELFQDTDQAMNWLEKQ